MDGCFPTALGRQSTFSPTFVPERLKANMENVIRCWTSTTSFIWRLRIARARNTSRKNSPEWCTEMWFQWPSVVPTIRRSQLQRLTWMSGTSRLHDASRNLWNIWTSKRIYTWTIWCGSDRWCVGDKALTSASFATICTRTCTQFKGYNSIKFRIRLVVHECYTIL